MSLGGGPGFLSILSGVAEGVGKVHERERQEKQDAIMNALRTQQIRSSQASIGLQRDREQRYVQDEEARQELQAKAIEQQAAQKKAMALQYRSDVQNMTSTIMQQQPGLDPTAAGQMADLHVRKVYEYEPPEIPEVKDPTPPSAAVLNFQNNQAHQAEVDKIASNPEITDILWAAENPMEALQAAQQLLGDHPMTMKAALEVWNSAQEDDKKVRDEEEEPLPLSPLQAATAKSKATEMLADLATGIEASPDSPEYLDALLQKFEAARAQAQAEAGEFSPTLTEIFRNMNEMLAEKVEMDTAMRQYR